MIEYTISDSRNGAVVAKSYQPDVSAKSENAAIHDSAINDTRFADIEPREVSDDAARPYVGL